MQRKEDFDYRRLSNVLQVCLLTVIASFFIAIFIYWFVFSDGRLSSDQEIWGQFGDYLGGVINPIVAFMALMALVVSIQIQAKEMRDANQAMQDQLKHFKDEAKKEDLIRAINALKEDLEARLSKEVNALNTRGPLFHLIGQHAFIELNPEHPSSRGKENSLSQAASREYKESLPVIRKKVLLLRDLLDEYDSLGFARSYIYTNIHRQEIQDTVMNMLVIGLLTNSEAKALMVDGIIPLNLRKQFPAPTYLEDVVGSQYRWWGERHG